MKRSAGILLYRGRPPSLKVLLVHPGGPFWAKKDDGAWSIPKGEYEESEEALVCARREFEEELGLPPPAGAYLDLGEIKQPSRKLIKAWAAEGEFDPALLKSNLFELEWPPKSGRKASFPEVDRAQWFQLEEARVKMLPGQLPLIERLIAILKHSA